MLGKHKELRCWGNIKSSDVRKHKALRCCGNIKSSDVVET